MHCPKCSSTDLKVIETRAGKDNLSIRRRRECLACHYRFTTIEEVVREEFMVVKRDGCREEFLQQKIYNGIRRACEKRPVDAEQIQQITQDITKQLQDRFEVEVESKAIGEMVMDALKKVDHIAYVRFASVYKDFRDLGEFEKMLDALKGEKLGHEK